MDHPIHHRRRELVLAALAAGAGLPAMGAETDARPKAPRNPNRPICIYAITFRGLTEVEKGMEDYFAGRKIPVEITYRDLNRDSGRMAGFLQEIRATRPDVIYTWGTSVTLGVVGPYDAVAPGHIGDIPVVFTLVASPVLAKIVPNHQSSGRNVTGVFHVAPTDAQIHAMTSYRKFETLGVLYTPTEKNSVVVLEELRRIGREQGFHTVERTFRLDSARKPVAEGAADLVRELKEAGAQWLYLPPDSFLGTLAESSIIPAAMELGLPTFASTEQLMKAGALSGLVCRYYNIGQFTGHKIEQVVLGRQAPAAIPVETLKRFSFQIRMPAAHRLKLLPPLPMFNYAELLGDSPANASGS